MTEPRDFSVVPTLALLDELQSLRAGAPALDEYIRRQEALAVHERELVRMVLQLVTLPRVAVIDLEATLYESAELVSVHGKEIIELGWSLLEPATGKVLERQQFYIRPTRGYVSPKCTELTHITPERLAGAPSFTEVMGEVYQLHRRHGIKVWAAFGHYDRDMLHTQCESEMLPHPWDGQRFFNVREMAGAFFAAGKKGVGLVKALERAGLKFEGRQHSGVDDAVNTARLLAHMLGR